MQSKTRSLTWTLEQGPRNKYQVPSLILMRVLSAVGDHLVIKKMLHPGQQRTNGLLKVLFEVRTAGTAATKVITLVYVDDA